MALGGVLRKDQPSVGPHSPHLRGPDASVTATESEAAGCARHVIRARGSDARDFAAPGSSDDYGPSPAGLPGGGVFDGVDEVELDDPAAAPSGCHSIGSSSRCRRISDLLLWPTYSF